MRDSAIVPGPALLMIMSLAVIHSGMLSTKPLMVIYTTHTVALSTAVSHKIAPHNSSADGPPQQLYTVQQAIFDQAFRHQLDPLEFW